MPASSKIWAAYMSYAVSIAQLASLGLHGVQVRDAHLRGAGGAALAAAGGVLGRLAGTVGTLLLGGLCAHAASISGRLAAIAPVAGRRRSRVPL